MTDKFFRTGYSIRMTIPFLLLFVLFAPESRAQAPAEIASHLEAIHELAQAALEHSRSAETAATVDDVRQAADGVFEAVWGYPSGLASAPGGDAKFYGWKTRWQSDLDDFELEDPEKFGTDPAEVTDPAELGIIGRGLYARELLFELQKAEENPHYGHVIASLSNAIGWMRMDYADARGGMPRVDLTAQWDAPSEFWQSTADTGWIRDALAQALNILKVNYEGDLDEARAHAADLSAILQKALEGFDANGNGSIEPAMMEGGLNTALQHAGLAGIVD